MSLKIDNKDFVVDSVKLRKKSKNSIFVFRGAFRVTRNILRSEWKLECSRFFKNHFGTITLDQNSIIKRYEVVMEVILKYCVIAKPDHALILGWPKQNDSLEFHQYFTLKELICILTDHKMPEIVDSILEEQFKIFCDRNSLVCRTKVSVENDEYCLGYCLLNVAFKDDIKESLKYFRKSCELSPESYCDKPSENIYRVNPVTRRGQEKYKRLLRLKEHIIKSLITNFGLR